MSILKVRQIKSKLFEAFDGKIDLYGISDKDKEKELKLLSRYLAAFAIYSTTGCTVDEAGSAVWDGGDDNGVDAAFYDQAEKQVLLVQSKWIQAGKGEPEAKDLATFFDGVEALVENELDGFGSRLKAKAEAISNQLMQPGTTIRIIIISTGSSNLADPSTRKKDKILSQLNGDEDDGIATCEVIGLKEVYESLSSGNAIGKIDLSATVLDWSKISNPHSAYFGLIDGSQLKVWWNTYGKRLISKNIRYDLGDTDVNIQIRNTALSDPEHFWYFNNGITLIADDVSRAPGNAASHGSGVFEFKGASIVNGAQTVSTLGKISDDSALGNVKVSMRVIILSGAPNNFGSDVTRTNNLQNKVEGRDFVSGDKEQARIKSEMEMEGVDYQYHRSEGFVPNEKSCDLIEVTTALACAYKDPSYSVSIKTGYGRFFNDLTKAPYKSLFNSSTSGVYAFNVVRILRVIDEWISNKKSQLSKKSGYGWGLLVHGNRAIAACVFKKINKSIVDSTISEINPNYADEVRYLCEEVYPKMLDILERDHKSRSLAVLFKSPTTFKKIYDVV